MPGNYIFYPPPMPARLVPPRIFAPIPDIAPSVDSPLPTSRAILNVIIQLWDVKYRRVVQSQIAAILPVDVGVADSPPGGFRGSFPRAILEAYRATAHIYVPRTVLHLPIDIVQQETNPPPFTRKDIHIVGKYFYDKEITLDRGVYYKQRRLFFISEDAAPTFTTGYLIAFQPNAFQVEYPGPFNSFQGMNRFISIPITTVREFLTITVGPLMREYKRGNSITIDFNISDPAENPPLPYNPEAVYLNLYRPNGSLVVSGGSMSNISQGLYRYTWQSSLTDVTGMYRIDGSAISGNNTAQTIVQGSFRLV